MVGAMIRNARIFWRSVVGTAAATPSMIAILWMPVQPRMISTRNIVPGDDIPVIARVTGETRRMSSIQTIWPTTIPMSQLPDPGI